MDSAETDSPALSRVDYKVVTCCRCGYAPTSGGGRLRRRMPRALARRIQNREHVADAGLAVGSDRRRWASIMTRAYSRGCGGGESDMADDDFALNVVLRQQAS